MIPSLRSHGGYIRFMNKHLKPVQRPKAHEGVVMKLELLDLTPLRMLFLPMYCINNGRPGYAPEDLMRTLIAMVLCGQYSPATWVENYLKDKHGFYAIISGFLPGKAPSVGCLYGFMSRILKLPGFCRKNHMRPKRKRLTRAQKKLLKDDKHKVTKRHIKIISKLADRFQSIYVDENSDEFYTPDAEKIVNQILELCCLNESVSRKMMDKKHLNISADGTKLKAYSNRYGKKKCKCESSSCDCRRFFNAPDASLGYDSYRETYVYGYNFYQVNTWSFDNKFELPVYLMMATGSRHDSVLGMYTMHRCTQTMGYGIDNGCFDSAHDATDFYRISHDIWHMKPFIPLNSRNESSTRNMPMSHITPDGIPVCRAGYQMHYNGHNKKDRDRLKWRCPIKASKNNEDLECEFINDCSPSDYGRVVYTHPKDYMRLHPSVPRESEKWQDVYDHRTSAERVFKREKNDFKLSFFRTRSKERNLFYALLTAIAVHIDSWVRQDECSKEKTA